MQIGDNLHAMLSPLETIYMQCNLHAVSNPVFWKKTRKILLSAEFAQRVAKVGNGVLL